MKSHWLEKLFSPSTSIWNCLKPSSPSIATIATSETQKTTGQSASSVRKVFERPAGLPEVYISTTVKAKLTDKDVLKAYTHMVAPSFEAMRQGQSHQKLYIPSPLLLEALICCSIQKEELAYVLEEASIMNSPVQLIVEQMNFCLRENHPDGAKNALEILNFFNTLPFSGHECWSNVRQNLLHCKTSGTHMMEACTVMLRHPSLYALFSQASHTLLLDFIQSINWLIDGLDQTVYKKETFWSWQEIERPLIDLLKTAAELPVDWGRTIPAATAKFCASSMRWDSYLHIVDPKTDPQVLDLMHCALLSTAFGSEKLTPLEERFLDILWSSYETRLVKEQLVPQSEEQRARESCKDKQVRI